MSVSASASAPPTIANPYVGPRPFRRGEKLFGRDAEIAKLADLLLAERIVLLYSPSGAGKTSLIQAGLVPRLQLEDFRVLPSIRVNLEVDAGYATGHGPNRYIRSAVASLSKDVSRERLDELARSPFDDYLAQLPRADGEPKDDVLVFDQFEELLTLDPTDSAVKRDFVTQLGFALRNRHRWALFAMREEYIAGLDPYLRLIPTRLATTFRLDLLKKEQATPAILEPTRNTRPRFTEDAARTLFDQLCLVRVQRPDGWHDEPGDYVEPVQLQVTCRRLWEKSHGAEEVTAGDVAALGSIQNALADYYAENVKAIAAATKSDERLLREWFAQITEHGVRAQVLQGPAVADSPAVLRKLEDVHLVRTETRRGATWYELAHDRLIEPLQQDNAAWFERNLSPFQRQAKLWVEQGEADGYLLRDTALDDAEAWIARQAAPLTKSEQRFREKCHRLREQERSRRRRARLLRYWAVATTIILLLMIGSFIGAMNARDRAREQRSIADVRALVAGSSANLQRDPNLSLSLARQAVAPSFLAGKTVRPEALGALFEAVQNTEGRTRVGPLGNPASAGVFSRDGSRMAVIVPKERLVRVFDAQTLEQVASVEAPQVWDVALSPDGSRLAIASSDHAASVRELPSGRQVLTLTGHSDQVFAVSYSRDGTRIATGSRDRTAKLWDAGTGAEMRTFAGHEAQVNTVAFGRRGALATGSDDMTARLWDTETGRVVHTYAGHRGAIREVAFTADGGLLASASNDRTARIWGAESGTFFGPMVTHVGRVSTVTFTPDGEGLVTGGDDGTVRLSRWRSDEIERVIRPGTGTISRVAVDPVGNRLAIATADGALALWDASPPFRGHTRRVTSVAFSPDGGRLASASNDSTVRLWNVASGSTIGSFRHPTEVTGVAFSRDGSQVATSGADGLARLYDVATGTMLREFRGHTAVIWYVAFSPTEDLLATASEDMTARLWTASTGALVGPLEGHAAGVNGLSFSGDGTRLVTASNDRTAKVWTVRDRRVEHTLTGHEDFVYAATFRPDGQQVVTTGKDKTVRLWDAASGKQVNQFAGHSEQIWDVASSKDGKLLATAGSDRFVVLRDLESSARTVRIPSSGEMTTTAFNPRGGMLAAGDAEGKVYLYPLDTPTLLDLAERRTTRPLRPEECRIYLGKRTCPKN